MKKCNRRRSIFVLRDGKEDALNESMISYVITALPFLFMLAIAATALFALISVAAWVNARRREREAYYRSETIRKLVESQAGASAIEFLREEQKNHERRRQEQLKLGGLVLLATGLGLIAMFVLLVPRKPVYAIGLVPLFIGIAQLAYVWLVAPKQP
jgi:hypothetical protein